MYKNIKDKELALQSVTYKDFFFRADKLNWETYESYSPAKEHVDCSMINDVNDAYNSLSDELKDDFDVVKAAYDSYKRITEYLKTAEPIAIYSDGVGINVDTDAMIDIIYNEYLGTFEEKYYDLFYELVENIVKNVATDEFAQEIEDIQENISIAYSDEKIDFAEINDTDIDKYFGKFVKRIFKNDKYRLDIDIYIDNIQEYCNFKEYTLEEFHTILSKVIMHELTHYYMFPAKIGDDIEKIKYANEPFNTLYYKDNCWYKTIEESLCNYIAYSQNWSSEQKEFIANFIQKQPDDYKYALNFSKLKKEPLEIAKQWRKLKIIPEDNKINTTKDKINLFAKQLRKNELYKNTYFFTNGTLLSTEDGFNYYYGDLKHDMYFLPSDIKELFII